MRGIIPNQNIGMLGRMRMGLRAISQRIGNGFNFLSSLVTFRSALTIGIVPIAVMFFAMASCKKGDIYSCPEEVSGGWPTVAQTHLLRLGHKKPSRKMIRTHADKFRKLNPDVDHPWDACRAWQGGAPLRSPFGPKVKEEVPVPVDKPCPKQKVAPKPSGPISSATKSSIIKETGRATRLIEKLREHLKRVKKSEVKTIFRGLIKALKRKAKTMSKAVTDETKKTTDSEAKTLLQRLKELIERAKLALKVHSKTTKKSRGRKGNGSGMKEPMKPPDWTK
jgi:hypothetical protein